MIKPNGLSDLASRNNASVNGIRDLESRTTCTVKRDTKSHTEVHAFSPRSTGSTASRSESESVAKRSKEKQTASRAELEWIANPANPLNLANHIIFYSNS